LFDSFRTHWKDRRLWPTPTGGSNLWIGMVIGVSCLLSRFGSRCECVDGLSDRVRGGVLQLSSHCARFQDVVEVCYLGEFLGSFPIEVDQFLILLLQLFA
jgi:hypothetical protein